MPATQMNMRIDSDLKAMGDLAIRECGSTPTKMVHAVWEYAARNRHKPKAMRDLVNLLENGADADRHNTKPNALCSIEEQVLRGPKLVEEYLENLGINQEALPITSFEEAKAAAFADEWEEAIPL